MRRSSFVLVALLLLSLLLPGCDLGPKEKEGGTPVANGTPGLPVEDATWHYPGPADPKAPPLLENGSVSGTGELRLKPGWEVASIEYVDTWWGLGEPGLNNQVIKREGADYKLDGATVSPENVQALVNALDHLYPAQMLMQGHAWTDDYPSWAVEVVGTDGQHLLLMASSTGNPGNGPWNVLYNGGLYAQYDGSLAKPLGQLFGGRLGKDDNPFPDARPTGQVNFSTVGLPPQLAYGFWGLLPISEGFGYIANADKSEIKGSIRGGSRIGSMKIGQIKELKSLQLLVGQSQVSCKAELLPEGDPWTATTAWEFTCPVASAKKGDHYQYPIKAQFGTEKGDPIDVTGELWGTWASATATARQYVLLQPPPEIEAALQAHPAARDLLSDHILGTTRYSASLSADTPLQGKRNGEAVLFGQTIVGGKTVRYTVGVQFAVEDGKATHWDLDRPALNEMLKSLAAQPLTGRVVAADGQAVINMWYAGEQPPAKERSFDDYSEAYSAQVNSCGPVPGGSFPASGKPLQAFSFNSSPYFYGAPFTLIAGQPVVNELWLYPSEGDAVQKALLPQALDTGESKPFASIFMESTPYGGGGPTLHIRQPEDAGEPERAVYRERLEALPATAEANQGEMVVRGVTLSVDNEGKLQVVSCTAPAAGGASPEAGGTAGPDQTANPPRLAYSTYFGGTKDSSSDRGQSTSADAVAVDEAGNVYIVGDTSASDLPLKNPYKTIHQGSLWDAFAAELDPNGSSLLFGSYTGSGFETTAYGVAVDKQGNIYITGSARDGFEAKNSPIQAGLRGDADAYVMKLSSGGKLMYSTYLGGSDYDVGYRIAVDTQGYVYVAGQTESDDFHVERPLQGKYGGKGEVGRNGDGFIARIAPDGSRLVYSTYLGGTGADGIGGIAVDDAGNAYVVGSTLSEDFPLAHPLQSKLAGGGDGFVTKISPDGQSLLYSTYLGGGAGGVGMADRAAEGASNIAVNAQGEAYVVGTTASPDFPMVKPLFSTFNGGVSFSKDEDSVRDAYLLKLNAAGSAILFSTYLGGNGEDRGYGIGLDAAGNVYVGGSTTSPDFPTERPLQKEYSGMKFGLATDSFVAKLDPTGSRLLYSTYFGAEGFDSASDFAVDSRGNVYLAGAVEAPSPGFPLAGKPFQSTNTGIRSAFVAKISDDQP